MNDSIRDLIGNVEREQGIARDNQINQLNQQRNIAHDQMAVGANASGLLFSNLPSTSQIKYDAQTYVPNVAKANQTYLTTMDKIIGKGQQYKQTFDKLNEAIMEANSDLKK